MSSYEVKINYNKLYCKIKLKKINLKINNVNKRIEPKGLQ